MKYMLMFKTDKPAANGKSPCKKYLPEMAKLTKELAAKGILGANEGLMPSDSGARVTRNGNKLAVTDGPFAEAKELVAGFAIVNVGSKQEAIDLAKQFLTIAGEGNAEVLEVFNEPPAA